MRLQEIIDQRAEERIEENKMLWLAQGTREKALHTARAFLAMGLSPQQVAQGTELPIEEVEALL